MLLSEAIKAFCAAKLLEGRASGTLAGYRHTLGDMLDCIGDLELNATTPAHIDAWLLSIRSRLKPSTAALWWRIARAFWRYMVARGDVARSPLVTKVPPAKPPTLRNLAFQDWEVDNILEIASEALREHVIVRFLLDTGCRAGALGTVTISGLDLAHRTAHAIEKGGREVVLDYSKETARLLRRWLRVRPDVGHDHVFCTSWGTPVNAHALYKMLRRLGERAGVENCHPHRFRHTVGRRFALAGAPVAVIQAKLNHTAAQTTIEFYSNQERGDVQRFTDACF